MPDTREAAGFVLACMDGGSPHYLLLRSAAHGTWGVPKGHLEPGESALAGARRETLEETGIDDLRVVQDFTRVIQYEVETRKRGRYLKRVTYFLALTPKMLHVQSDEHAESGWFTLEEALSRIDFEQFKQVLREADAHLHSQPGR
ncbi:MAG: NUDIX domain-containing protein [Planctomycetes bacterium]|nr:NUDIX domain-containing protein [Planctomycetota bacterium]MCW8134827.1 NUDIX domain-containing protein [Planctomycetota bacterium]